MEAALTAGCGSDVLTQSGESGVRERSLLCLIFEDNKGQRDGCRFRRNEDDVRGKRYVAKVERCDTLSEIAPALLEFLKSEKGCAGTAFRNLPHDLGVLWEGFHVFLCVS